MAKIHPLATVSPLAKLADSVEVGPYAYIDDNVEIGEGTKVYPHATIFSYVKIGTGCQIFPGAVLPAGLHRDSTQKISHILRIANLRCLITLNNSWNFQGPICLNCRKSRGKLFVVTSTIL